MKRALVTGHKGFIGQHLCATLKAQGVKVEGIDLKYGDDIRHTPLPDVDICFHLAAQTDARCSAPIKDAETNIMGTLRLLEKYRGRLIFASSSAVNYPSTPYAISKLTGEHYCKLYGARVVRLCNIHGAGGHGVFERFEEDDPITIYGEGDQIRTYATVVDAVLALINTLTFPAGSVNVLHGKDMTVTEIADRYFRDKPRVYGAMAKTDIVDGRQL